MTQTTSSAGNAMDALDLLMDDHERVRELFEEFEGTEDSRIKRQIFEAVRNELIIHTKLEEEIFYPSVRAKINDDDLVDEAEEEHHIAKMVLDEMEGMHPDHDRYTAKFMVLAESVNRHIREEEEEMFSKVRAADLDLEGLGEHMAARKQELRKEMGMAYPTHKPRPEGVMHRPRNL